jgi:hypothetical protein
LEKESSDSVFRIFLISAEGGQMKRSRSEEEEDHDEGALKKLTNDAEEEFEEVDIKKMILALERSANKNMVRGLHDLFVVFFFFFSFCFCLFLFLFLTPCRRRADCMGRIPPNGLTRRWR